ncbi:MAG: hypothetical protein WD066_15960 [Planctomycetaceae bacterium]
MGDLWEFVLNRSAKVHCTAKGICTRDHIFLFQDSWRGEDLFLAEGVGYVYATERAKDFLEEHAGGCVCFQEAQSMDSA